MLTTKLYQGTNGARLRKMLADMHKIETQYSGESKPVEKDWRKEITREFRKSYQYRLLSSDRSYWPGR
jgi:hypothetical protein